MPDQGRTPQHLMLDALCCAYEHLLEHLDALDEAVSSHPEWDGYRLISRCVNPAVAIFGRSPVGTEDVSALCADLLRRLKGLLDAELPDASPVFSAFEAYREAVLHPEPLTPTDLSQYQVIGEDFSTNCYLQFHAPGSPNLLRPAELVVSPRNQPRFISSPNKEGGTSAIVFEFTTHQFTFDTFVNLPFYFFHEYFSHIHSAKMYAESYGTPAPFEDGWLLYAAYQFYRQKVNELSCPEYRRYYAANYIYGATSLESNRSARFGYQQAEGFEMLAGPERFWNLTLHLAFAPYNCLPDCLDLHTMFVPRMRTWLKRLEIRSPTEVSEALELLDLALQDEVEPMKCLLDVLA